jgi:hypothetical protein
MSSTLRLKSRSTVRKPALPALFIVAGLLAVSFLARRGQPEYLKGHISKTCTISGNEIYDVDSSNAPTSVNATSFRDEKARLVVQEEIKPYWPVPLYAPSPFSLIEGTLYYAVQARLQPVQPVVLRDTKVVVVAEPSQGTYLLRAQDSSPQTAGRWKREVWPVTPLPQTDVRFQAMPAQGGKSRLAARLRGENFRMVGSHVFWIRPAYEQAVRVIPYPNARKPGYWTEVSAHSDLMLTSLIDGASRCIRHGVPRSTSLMGGKAGVTWTEPAPYPGEPTLFYARAADGSVRSLGTRSGTTEQQPCLEAAGRLYWTAGLSDAGRAGINARALMSASLDGSDRRELVAQVENHYVAGLSLHCYSGDLYCCLLELPAANEDDSRRRLCLCRLNPDSADPVEILRRLPAMSGDYLFQEGYLYLGLVNEINGSGLGASIKNLIVGSNQNSLCRFSLKQ